MFTLQWAVSNTAIAALLAIGAALAGNFTTRPQIRHTLWILVLVKLVTPPLVQIPIVITQPNRMETPATQAGSYFTDVSSPNWQESEPSRLNWSDAANHVAEGNLPVIPVVENVMVDPPSRTGRAWQYAVERWPYLLVGIWGIGSCCWFVLAGIRLMRFHILLRHARPASETLLAEVDDIIKRIGLHHPPRVLVVDAQVPPLIWSFVIGRPVMMLPGILLDSLQTRQRLGLIAHELAHLGRCDHWIRWFELVVLGIHWWNPLAWWARCQIQQAEEECCDAWALWAFPDQPHLYAQTLMDTVDFLSGSTEPKHVIVTAFSQGKPLKRRIEMIMSSRRFHQLSWQVRAVLVLLALAVLPMALLGSQSQSTDEDSTARQRSIVAGGHDSPSESPKHGPWADEQQTSEAERIDMWTRVSGKESDKIARRHLRLVATAVLSYADEHEGRLPPVAVPNPELPEEKRLSGLVLLLPYLGVRPPARYMSDKAWEEQRHVLEDSDLAKRAREVCGRIDLKKAWDDPANDEAARSIVWEFLVPGFGSPRNEQGYAVSNIAFVQGFAGVYSSPGTDGAFDATGVKMSQIRDGISQTLGLGQVYTKVGPWIAAGTSTSRFLYGFNDRVRLHKATFGSRDGVAGYFSWVDADVVFLDLDKASDSVVQALACRSDGIALDHTRDVPYYADFVSWEADRPARVRALEDKVSLLQSDLDAQRRRKDEPISAEQAAPIEAEIYSLRVKIEDLRKSSDQ